MKLARTPTSSRGTFEPPAIAIFALIFSITYTLHAQLIRLPYFWDEAGHYIPAARDILLKGELIPTSTISNAHPPLVMAWLALWWKLSGYATSVTRMSMLLVAAFALLGVFRLARQVANVRVALAATLLTAIFPVWFAQSSLAHLDIAAAAFTIWGLGAYLRGSLWRSAAWFAFAGVAKETAIVAPLTLFGMELLASFVPTLRAWWGTERNVRRSHAIAAIAISLAPLALWFAYHYASTGRVFGNPEFFRYNVAATAHPARIVIAMAQRVWHLLGYMNMFTLTGATVLAMLYTPKPTRRSIEVRVLRVFTALLAAYVVLLSIVGGAVIARYMLPVYPLVMITCVAVIENRVRQWLWVMALAVVAFGAALLAPPMYQRSAPEDNLNYAEFIRLHQDAAAFIEQRYPASTVLTAWPASDELTKPYLGYVEKPMRVVRIEHFSSDQLALARQAAGSYDLALLFSTKLEPRFPLIGGSEWWQNVQERFFDYHRDLPAPAAAALLGGEIVYQRQRNGQWVAVVAFNRIHEANLR